MTKKINQIKSTRIQSFLSDSSLSRNPDGSFRIQNYTLSNGLKIPLAEDKLKESITQPPFNFNLENETEFLNLSFSWEYTKDIIQHGIVCYIVNYDWKSVPDHYTKHENEPYYVFLEPAKISFDILKNVLGNTSYSDVDVTELKQIVSFMELHVASDGKFKHQPSWIMSQVALAIGIQEMEVVTIRRE